MQTQVTETFDSKRQQAKAEIYGQMQEKRDQAREIRMANGGYETDESRRLDEEAASFQRAAKYVDAIAITAAAGPDVSNQLTGQLVVNTDLAHRAASSLTKIVLQIWEASGQNCTQREVDRDQVEAGPDGKLYAFNNGIFNDEEKALNNAARQSSNEANAQGVYVVLNSETGNPIAEALYAGYDKLNELLGGRLPLTSAEWTNKMLIVSADSEGGEFNSVNHSRGSMTMANAFGSLLSEGRNELSIGSILYNGAAANAERSARLVFDLRGDAGRLYESTQA